MKNTVLLGLGLFMGGCGASSVYESPETESSKTNDITRINDFQTFPTQQQFCTLDRKQLNNRDGLYALTLKRENNKLLLDIYTPFHSKVNYELKPEDCTLAGFNPVVLENTSTSYADRRKFYKGAFQMNLVCQKGGKTLNIQATPKTVRRFWEEGRFSGNPFGAETEVNIKSYSTEESSSPRSIKFSCYSPCDSITPSSDTAPLCNRITP